MGKITLYHGTFVENVASIRREGLKSKFEGVYLTDSQDSACRWTGLRARAMGFDTLAVIEVEVEEEGLEPGVDHSPLMEKIFGVGESIVSPQSIPADQIKGVEYFEMKKEGGPGLGENN